MANANNIGGGFQFTGGSQEENITAHSNLAVILGNAGTLASEKSERKGRLIYKEGFLIPSGGNIFHKIKFIDGDQVSCSCITHAFADFRVGKFGFEGDDYVKGTPSYLSRILIDIVGYLRTSKLMGIQILILSATGCGAFGHDPNIESEEWKRVLESE